MHLSRGTFHISRLNKTESLCGRKCDNSRYAILDFVPPALDPKCGICFKAVEDQLV